MAVVGMADAEDGREEVADASAAPSVVEAMVIGVMGVVAAVMAEEAEVALAVMEVRG